MSSAGTIDADVNITINAEDHASVQVESAAKRINRQWREMRLEQRAVQQSFELSNRKFTATARVLSQMGSVMIRVQSIFNTYQLAQIRMQDATRNLAEAKRRLSDAIVQNGLDSKEAIEAQEDVTQFENQEQSSIIGNILQGALAVGVGASTFGRVPAITGAFKNLLNVFKGGKGPKTPKLTDFVDDAKGAGGKGFLSRALGGLGGLASKIPFGAGAAGGIGAGVMFLSDIPAAGGTGPHLDPDPYGWNDFTGEVGKSFNTTINVLANTSQEIVDDIQTAVDDIFRFGGN